MPLVSCRISELESSVDRLHKEVEQLREQRNQQKQLADSNARQRDMYKALLTQSTGFSLPPQGDKKILRPVCSIFVGEYTHTVKLLFLFIYFVCNFRSRLFSPTCTGPLFNTSYSLYSSESCCCRVGTECSDKSSFKTGTHEHISIWKWMLS